MDEKQPETSKTGVWIDHATGKVVKSRPVSGTQLVPPGGVLRPDRKAAIAAAEAALETADDPVPVETATTPAPAKKATKGS